MAVNLAVLATKEVDLNLQIMVPKMTPFYNLVSGKYNPPAISRYMV